MPGAEQCPAARAAGPAAVGGAEQAAGGDHPQTGPLHHRGHGEGTDSVRGSPRKSLRRGGGHGEGTDSV